MDTENEVKQIDREISEVISESGVKVKRTRKVPEPVSDSVGIEKEVKITQVFPTWIGIDFDGFGCQIQDVDGSKYKVGRTVKVRFYGTIGKPNFRKELA